MCFLRWGGSVFVSEAVDLCAQRVSGMKRPRSRRELTPPRPGSPRRGQRLLCIIATPCIKATTPLCGESSRCSMGLYPKHFPIFPDIHPFMHTFIRRQRNQPRKATAGSSGAARVRCLARGRLNTARRCRGSNLQPRGHQPTHSTS